MKKIFIPGLILLSLTGCSDSEKTNDLRPDYPTTSEITLSRAESDVNEAVNDFGVKFFVEFAKQKQAAGEFNNFAVSPVSMALGLGIYANTAGGDAAQSVADALGIDDLDAVNSLSRKLMQFLPDKSNKVTMSLANAVWHTPGISPTPDYNTRMSEYFFGEVSPLDFTLPSAKDIMNHWCSVKTHGLIPEPFKDVNPLTILAFANALYFKAPWGLEFDPKDTKEEAFTTISGKIKNVSMMHTTTALKHRQADDCQLLVLPYEGTNEMVVILPDENTNFPDFVNSMDYSLISQSEYATSHDIVLSMPKFESTVDNESCNRILANLGVNLTTTLEGMLGYRMTPQSVMIFHHTKVITNESGTEAAAITNGLILGAMPGMGTPMPLEINLNRPFLYFIRNTVTGSILLMGTVTDF